MNPAPKIPLVRPPADAPATPVLRARGARMAVLIGPEQGAPNFILRRFWLAPGGRIPTHMHPEIEHEQMVVRGEMVLGSGGSEKTVKAGDAVYIPAGAPHWYENRGAAEVEFLCIIPATVSYGTEWLEDPPAGAYLG
jgi:quercetin dioxygenase-like cupin family protein